MAQTETYIKRTPEEDEKLAERAAEKALEKAGTEALQHKMRIENGICYARDLAWLWDCSTRTMQRWLSNSDVEPVSTAGREHLWDVEEANEALAE